jgi:ketosteroid isomerase-like protein
VSEKTNREIIERYVRAVIEQDLEVLRELRHADYVAEWPQSGERIRGAANAHAINANYPGGLPPTEHAVVKGEEDRWVTTPVGTLLRITGTGDVYTGLFTVVYPGDPRPWHCVAVAELRDGKVLKETLIFGAPFDAPAWRAQWVERM